MKKASIQLKYDEEKLSALEKVYDKKEVDLEVELLHTLQKLYENMCRRPSGNILKAGKHVKGGLA